MLKQQVSMAPLYSSIDALVASRTNQAIKVRCVRCYDKYATGSKTEIVRIECIVHDDQGTRIQLTVPHKLIKMFEKKMNEGLVYQIMNFMVKRNGSRFRVTDHTHRLELTAKSMISEIFPMSFPKYMFSFKSFEEIAAIEKTDGEALFDVIGLIIGKGFVKNDADCKMVELKLEDEKHNRIFCTLWEDYVDMFLEQLNHNDNIAPIIIIQLCKPNQYRGEMRACTSYNGSKIYLNSDLPEIEAFRKQIAGNGSLPKKLELTYAKASVDVDDFLNGNIAVKTIDDVFTTEDGEHWICAKIYNVDCYAHWCYNACKKCTRKVMFKRGSFYCGNCDKYDGFPNKRYQLILNVIDSTNNASLLVWDKEATALIGKKAVEICLDQKEAADSKLVPKEVERSLIDRVIMFKIQLRQESSFVEDKPYTVTKICTDELAINHFWKENEDAAVGGSLYDLSQKSDSGVDGSLNDISEKAYLKQCESLSQITDLTMDGSFTKDLGGCETTPKKALLTASVATSKIPKQPHCGESVKRKLVDEFEKDEKEVKKMDSVKVKKEKI